MAGTPKGSKSTSLSPLGAVPTNALAAFGTISHDIHRRRRAAVSPLFSKAACAASESSIYNNVKKLLADIDDQIRATGSAELRKTFLAFTTDTLSEHCFGHSTGLLLDDKAAAEWQRTIRAVAILTPLAKQFPWLIPFALKCPLWLMQTIAPDLARIVKTRRVRIHRRQMQGFQLLNLFTGP